MTSHVVVRITRMDGTALDMQLPQYATDHSAGMDLCAAVNGERILRAGETALIPTGFAIALPEGYEAQVRPRSGLAAKNQVTVLNSPGTIDADYRGEIKVILINLSNETFLVQDGERIAQLIVASHERVDWISTEELVVSGRGSGGFGSPGRT